MVIQSQVIVWPGRPYPLGATWDGEGVNFAIFSEHAEKVELCLFDNAGRRELHRINVSEQTDQVWHSYLPEARPGLIYGYRVHGPYDPAKGLRCNPNKLLLDPYAKQIVGDLKWSDSHFGYRIGSSKADLSFDRRDSAPGMLKSMVIDPAFTWGTDRPPATPWHNSVIYEMHVKGFTIQHPQVPTTLRGTYAGMGTAPVIDHLLKLGVTAVELMPVHYFIDDRQLIERGLRNYWGYNTIGFFAPAARYLATNSINEFKTMVKTMHSAGIEVILDVVYNHTAEGNELGPTYSFKGLGNSTYYLLDPDKAHYRNDTGTGNTLNCANPIVRKMILDSMRYWVTEMHVDGFRFDLASVFTRNDDGSLNLKDPPILSEINADPAFAGIRLIAEAWDVSTYELGRSFPGFFWLQWNGQFRDNVRSFVKGDEGKVGALMTRIYGSDDLFPDTPPNVYHPYQSLNYVTSHDGFCLYDLVAYNQKHNEANGDNNTDGSDYNLSWNCGWEGDVGAPAEVLELRQRQIKNFCTVLFLSNGTPMFCAGDEFMRTQGGNNNPYNQDNETTWLDWDLLQRNQGVFRFFKKMIAFRKSHPSLGRSRFWREDVSWYGTNGPTDLSPQSHTLAFCLHGASQNDQDIYVMINAYWQDLTFTLQEGDPQDWKRVVDTSLSSPDDFSDSPMSISSLAYPVKARSVAVFLR